jgi:hypothetical protein
MLVGAMMGRPGARRNPPFHAGSRHRQPNRNLAAIAPFGSPFAARKTNVASTARSIVHPDIQPPSPPDDWWAGPISQKSGQYFLFARAASQGRLFLFRRARAAESAALSG